MSTAHEHPEHPVVERHCDVAVIGGSAAGLAAALQLARQRRSVIVVDDGTPRNAAAEHVHGYLGGEGTPPGRLLEIGREEVRGYGGEILTGRTITVHRSDDSRFRVELTGGHAVLARRVLAATGIDDELPEIEGLAQRWGRDVVGCPFCHGFEVRDQRIVQIVVHPMGLHPTALLRHLTADLTVVLHDADDWVGAAGDAVAATVDAMVAANVPVIRDEVARIVTNPEGTLVGVELADGTTLDADAVLTGAHFRARAEMLTEAGVIPTPHPTGLGDAVGVDQTGQTAVPGIFAAGNLTDPSMQVLQAAAHGSLIGAMIAFDLAADDLHGGRATGETLDWDHRYGAEGRMWSMNPNGTLVREASQLAKGRALDVGAGEGADALWLAENGWQVTAYDISGNALARLRTEANRRGLPIEYLHGDANDPCAFGTGTYDLVSLQYGSFHRTPDQRGLRNLLGAVAPGGTLLVVGHDLTPMREPIDVATQTRIFDPEAFVGVEEIAATLAESHDWQVEVHETRPRPPGAASTHHVADVVLRARRT